MRKSFHNYSYCFYLIFDLKNSTQPQNENKFLRNKQISSSSYYYVTKYTPCAQYYYKIIQIPVNFEVLLF